MRSLLVMLVMLAALLVGGWIGGETLLARTATRLIASDPRIAAAGVDELRDVDRIGIRVNTPQFEDAAKGVTAAGPWLDLWVPPSAPNELHLSLPPAAVLTAAGRSIALGPQGAEGDLRFSPTHGFALSEAGLQARALTIDAGALADVVEVRAVLAGFGHDAPVGAGAAYDVTGTVAALSLTALTGGAMEGIGGVTGAGRVWLSAVPLSAKNAGLMQSDDPSPDPAPDSSPASSQSAPGPSGSVAPRSVSAEPSARQPRLIGFRADGVTLTLDDLQARVFGRVTGDADGRAVGTLLIDTADLAGFLNVAAQMGALPKATVPLATTMLSGLSQGAGDAQSSDPAPDQPSTPGSAPPRHERAVPPAWPDPQPGEIRIPLTFKDGKAFLGSLPVAPAPMLVPSQAG